MLKLVCLSVCVSLIQSQVFLESRPPPPTIVALPTPLVAAQSVKSPPPPVAAPPPTKIVAPLPPVRARIGVKTVPRPQPVVQQVLEQQEVLPVGVAEPFNFNYDVKDEFGNGQFRKEEGDSRGTVRGSYGYTDAAGLYRIVDYVADQDGFRASIRSNEPGLVDAPANPADITLAAEATPLKIKEQIRAIPPYNPTRLRSARRANLRDLYDREAEKYY